MARKKNEPAPATPAEGRRLCILHVASEMAPFIKTGGLADVLKALPIAQARAGHEVHVAIPCYKRVYLELEKRGVVWTPGSMTIEAGGVDHQVGVGTVLLDGVQVHALACNELYDRDGIYGPSQFNDYEDNTRRFAVLCKAALALPGFLGFTPHVAHAHDWQAGLVPALLQRGFNKVLPATRSVFTIHNIAYQGAVWHFDMKLTGLDWGLFNPQHCEHFGRLNLLKTGIVFCDRLTTVSRRYAEEIQTAEYAWGLDAVIRASAYKLSGITNGVDLDDWDPLTDKHIPAHFSADDLAGKAECKRALRRQSGMVLDGEPVMVGVVSRLVEMKGIDLVLDAVEPYILAGRMQLVVLGSGDLHFEHRLNQLQARHRGWAFVWYGYNEPLAHQIIAGSDLFLMPSRQEPCGLTQMYAMRYGTLPIVRYTGGLADTVRDVISGTGNGFTFGPIDLGHFSSVLDRALGLYHHFPKDFQAAQQQAMAEDNSWRKAAASYLDLYRSVCFV